MGFDTTVVSVGGAVTTPSTDVTAGTTSCMDCIRGKDSSGLQNVWCSAAWNYEYKVLPVAEAYPVANQANNSFDATGAENDASTAAKKTKGDLGFCCYNMVIA